MMGLSPPWIVSEGFFQIVNHQTGLVLGLPDFSQLHVCIIIVGICRKDLAELFRGLVELVLVFIFDAEAIVDVIARFLGSWYGQGRKENRYAY
jgi:hypothetical protein